VDLSTLLVGGALTGVVVGFWNKIKQGLLWLVSFVYETVDIQDAYLSQSLLEYLIVHSKRSPFYRKVFTHFGGFNRTTGVSEYLVAEVLGKNSAIYWLGRTPLVFGKNNNEKKISNPNAAPGGAAPAGGEIAQHPTVSRLSFIRGSIDVDKLLADAEEYRENNRHDAKFARFFVRHCRSSHSKAKTDEGHAGYKSAEGILPYYAIHGDWIKSIAIKAVNRNKENYSSHQPASRDNLQHLYYPDEVLELIEEMKHWLDTRAWHREKKIPWKRGWLLHGKPGTGKTALARAFCRDLDVPLFVFDLADMSNNDFIEAWQSLKFHPPAVVLFEDFDNVFHGRQNVKAASMMGRFFGPQLPRKTKTAQLTPIGGSPPSTPDDEEHHVGGHYLSFDTILQAIDGVEVCDGIFLIITTNHLDKVDEAIGRPAETAGVEATMSTRPGRIDRVIELKDMLPAHKKLMSNWILSEFPVIRADLHKWIEDNPDVPETPAQFQERCSRLALQEKFRLKKEQTGGQLTGG
jgi:hypothetical protein